ncbi:MAG: hypothetical protein ACP6IP_03165 [Candidatus Njordarchaeia archaeon]
MGNVLGVRRLRKFSGRRAYAISIILIVLLLLAFYAIMLSYFYSRTSMPVVDDDVGYWVARTSDGGYIIAGYKHPSYGWILKVNSKGEIEWSNIKADSSSVYYCVLETSSSQYIAVGRSFGPWQALVTKIDQNGKTIWSKTYGEGNFTEAKSIIQAPQNTYIITGKTKSAEDYNAWIMRIDGDGNVIWNKTYGGPADEGGHQIIESADGGYVVAASVSIPSSKNFKLWLLKVDENGDLVWNRTYGEDLSWSFSIVQAADGGYIVAGSIYFNDSRGSDVWLLKVDENGSVVWNRTYGGDGSDKAFSIIQATDGGYVVAGSTSSFGVGKSDVWLFKIDEDGDVVWNRTYGGDKSDNAYSIARTVDGGYVVVGSTTSFGVDGDDVWLLRVDKIGDLIWSKRYSG